MAGLPSVDIDDLKQYLLANNISNNFLADIDFFNLKFKDQHNNMSSSIGGDIGFDIKINKLLRIVPNRRLVFRGGLGSNKVIIKLFIDSDNYKKDYLREQAGYNNLKSASSQLPNIIASRICDKNKISYFIVEYIEHDSSKDDFKLLIAEIARLHDFNTCQVDLHFDNFIIKSQQVYNIDWSSIYITDNIKQQLSNFSLFLAQLPVDYSDNWDEYINYYLSCRKKIVSSDYKDYLSLKARKSLKSRITKYLRKCTRANTEIASLSEISIILDNQRSLKGLIKRKYLSNKSLLEFIAKLATNFRYSKQTIKSGNTAKVSIVELDGRKYILKDYFFKNKFQQLLATIKSIFIQPRAMNSWRNANLLELVGIKTASPIAYAAKREGILTSNYYFIMEYLDGIDRLDSILENTSLEMNAKQDYMNKINILLKYLKFLNIVHRDFKTVNIGFIDGTSYLMDLDAMQFICSDILFCKYQYKDKIRIKKCLASYPLLVNSV